MFLSDNLKKNNIIIRKNPITRWELIEEMVDLALKNKEILQDDIETIKKSLIEREKSMSTGIGNGVAMPHCTSSRINDLVLIMTTTDKGIDFDSIDNQPVRLVILLIFPKSKFSQHIKTLANIAKMMNDCDLREKLLEQKTPESIMKVLKDYRTDNI
jgi:PTS system fructose-specific IIA component